VHHSDRGVQYASKDSVALLEAHQLPIIMFESHMTESILDHYRSRLEQPYEADWSAVRYGGGAQFICLPAQARI